jgi:hypothetical protein
MNASAILNEARELAGLIQALENQDLYQRIVGLRDQIFALSEENLALRERVRDLERNQQVNAQIFREGNVYYLKTANEKKGPFCMTCWDADGKLINLIVTSDPEFGTSMHCGRCAKT